MSEPAVSVVIPTYQRRDSLARALDALARQTLAPERYEVIVVIDGSTDGTRELMESFAALCAVRALSQENRGRAAACNAGLRAARGALAVLLDDDMEPAPGCLAAHLAAHDGRPRLGVVGAVPVPVDPASPPVVDYVGTKFNRHLDTLSRPGHRFGLRDFYSGNFSIDRGTLLEVGGFDEAFTLYGNEDLELSLRLARAGVTLMFSADACAVQRYTKSFAALARDNEAKGRTAVQLASKHPEAFRDLKLSHWSEGSPRWRTLRAALLAATRFWPGTSGAVVHLVGRLERRRRARMHSYYHHALDYFYWLGARRALRENRRAGRGLTSLSEPAGAGGV
ncbi:MAG TPA: glycosyltransferase family 2 protein [Gemmatimonadales bacterium]|nr:glycosyltransferase family 2 protein [Gemmatimonadales bacterium]